MRLRLAAMSCAALDGRCFQDFGTGWRCSHFDALRLHGAIRAMTTHQEGADHLLLGRRVEERRSVELLEQAHQPRRRRRVPYRAARDLRWQDCTEYEIVT